MPTEPSDRRVGELQLCRVGGRWRAWRHGVLALPVALAGWGWFGPAGALLLLLWWWHRRPGQAPVPAHWRVDLGRVRTARLGPWRTRITVRGGPALEIFHDEIPAGELACLRRLLKRQLAAG